VTAPRSPLPDKSEMSGESLEPDGPLTLDCRSQLCPLPIIALAKKIRNIGLGEVIRVLADDPAAANDIPAWCRMKGQEYLGSPEVHTFDVRRVS